MLEKYETSDRYTRGRKDVFVVGKELAVLEMYLLIPIKVSWQKTPGDSAMVVCIVCPTQAPVWVPAPEQLWWKETQVPNPVTHQSF